MAATKKNSKTAPTTKTAVGKVNSKIEVIPFPSPVGQSNSMVPNPHHWVENYVQDPAMRERMVELAGSGAANDSEVKTVITNRISAGHLSYRDFADVLEKFDTEEEA